MCVKYNNKLPIFTFKIYIFALNRILKLLAQTTLVRK